MKDRYLEKVGPLEKGQIVPPPCPGCEREFKIGDIMAAIPIGPGDDPEERKKAREGKAHQAIVIFAHWACATGEEQESVTELH